MSNLVGRQSSHEILSAELARLSSEQLMELLNHGKQLGPGIGGTSMSLMISEKPVFVKKVSLTELERQNPHSTENLFKLPYFYQYGIGSTGFGAWRELATHCMTTDCVLSGECQNFPILYHWRVLPEDANRLRTSEGQTKLNSSVQFWENSNEVRARLQAIQEAKFSLVLFLEYFPETVDEWFNRQLSFGGEAAAAACRLAENELNEVTQFMKSKGLIHFDGHFRNLLTDGSRIYFADFGLAVSNRFSLSKEEIAFFSEHSNYDRFYTMTHLVNRLSAAMTDREDLDPSIKAVVERNTPIALIMNRFFQKLQTETRKAEFPTDALTKVR
jgi:hypothetical protein